MLLILASALLDRKFLINTVFLIRYIELASRLLDIYWLPDI